MKKVLIITYYWIPSGGSGVQRWVKFTKYLRDFGWEPVVYTPSNPEFPSIDSSFGKDIPTDVEVIKTPIWEPYNIYRTMMGRKGEAINAGFISENKKSGWKDKLSIWVRGNFLIPDPRRFWVKPSVRFLSKYIQENPVDAIISTGPPHSMHLVGMGLKKKFPRLKWVADFRDPWTGIYFFDDLKLNSFSKNIHFRLEKKVLAKSDKIIVVSQGMKNNLDGNFQLKTTILTNGYDSQDFVGNENILDEKFSISHIGLLTEKQNPVLLWKILAEICNENEEFNKDLQIKLIGKTDFSVIKSIQQNNIEDKLTRIDYIPHDEAVRMQHRSQLLLLLLVNKENTQNILTGKFFEYLAAKRPILAIGAKDGDVATVLKKAKAGKIVDFAEEKELKAGLLEFYKQYQSGTLNVNPDGIEQFSRSSLTRELADLLNTL
ncbi:MAG TPA: hypothetical protein VK152_02345 [Paludibacter sp.]|nr:hypothetical protein [Paludibacter sp.]